MFKTILFPLDPNWEPEDTTCKAIELAKTYQSDITLLAVLQPNQGVNNPKLIASQLKKTQKQIQEANIKCDLNENQLVNTGERFGIIRFGSRVDVYLPLSTTIFCVKGQKTVAGETVIADFDSKEESRLGDMI